VPKPENKHKEGKKKNCESAAPSNINQDKKRAKELHIA